MRKFLCGLFLFAIANTVFLQPAWAQIEDFLPSNELIPAPSASQEALAQKKALEYYAEGLLHQKEDRLLAAIKAFEKSIELAPQSTGAHRALIPLYLALDRKKDAVEACRQVLKFSPDDFEVWYWYAKHLRREGQKAQAMEAIQKGLACQGLDAKKELLYRMLALFGDLAEQNGEFEEAGAIFTRSAEVLQEVVNETLVEGPTREELQAQIAAYFEKSGNLFVKAGNSDRALAAFHKAQTTYPKIALRLNLNLAEICLAQKKYEQALGFLDRYLRYLPTDTKPHELKILLLEKLDRKQDILPWLEQASRLDRFNLNLRFLLGQQYRRQGQPEKAERIFRDLVSQSPKVPFYKELFDLYTTEPQFGLETTLKVINNTFTKAKGRGATLTSRQQARTIITVLRKDPTLAKGLVQTAWRKFPFQAGLAYETSHLLAMLADENNQLVEAEAFYQTSLKKVPDDKKPLIYEGLFRVLWRARKYQEIVTLAKEGLKTAEEAHRILFYTKLAQAYSQQGDFDRAVKQADLAIESASPTTRLKLQGLRIRILIQAQQIEKAEKECQELLEKYKGPGEILEIRYLLSHVYHAADKFPQAEKQLKEILKIDPSNAAAYNDLGYFWADRGIHLQEAEKYIRRALELDRDRLKSPFTDPEEKQEDNAAYVDSLGWVLFRQGRHEEACKELKRAISLPGGDDPVMWDHLGDVYLQMKRPEEARRAWEKARQLYEQNVRTRDNRYNALKEKLKQLNMIE